MLHLHFSLNTFSIIDLKFCLRATCRSGRIQSSNDVRPDVELYRNIFLNTNKRVITSILLTFYFFAVSSETSRYLND